jgi:hypothetical protein
MSEILGNGSITFGDGTTMSSAVVPWTNLTNGPTQLSQFTNNLGNYGNFITIANIQQGSPGYYDNPSGAINACGSKRGSIGHLTSGSWGLEWNSNLIKLACYNCNCACNC